mgnify:CR=1 FL=1
MLDESSFTTKPVIPWIGGKRRLLKHLLPRIPDHTSYVEPFCGAAALYFAKTPSKAEVLNDINGELVNLYRVLKHHLEEFVRQFRWALVSRQVYEWHQAEVVATLTDIQRAARFYFLQRTSFGGKVAGQTFGVDPSRAPRLNLLRIEEELTAAHLRLSRTTVEQLPWHQCIQRYDRPSTFFYCDPPYWQTEGYGVDFDWGEYERLAELALTIKGHMLISLGGHPDIVKLFDQARFNIDEVPLSYSVGGAKGRTTRKELIITPITGR